MSEQNVRLLSFPRSGRYMLKTCLVAYFGQRVWDNTVSGQDPDFHEMHDFKLSYRNDPGDRYVIMVRHPLEALCSWYKWWRNYDQEQGRTIQDTRQNFLWFLGIQPPVRVLIGKCLRREIGPVTCLREIVLRLRQQSGRIPPYKLLYWRDFTRKWIIENRNPNTLTPMYGDFIRDPSGTLRRVIEFIQPDKAVDESQLQHVLEANPIAVRNRIEDFPYYDREFFKGLESVVRGELEQLGIPLL